MSAIRAPERDAARVVSDSRVSVSDTRKSVTDALSAARSTLGAARWIRIAVSDGALRVEGTHHAEDERQVRG